VKQAGAVGNDGVRRRWPLVASAVFVFFVLAAAAVRFLWLPAYRPSLHPDERYGVDVSSHQGRIDWSRVARDHIGFAYLKATEGSDHVDDRFAVNWAGAGRAGVDRGAYHFFTLCRSGVSQARNFLRTVPDTAGALPPAVDLELKGNCRDRPTTTRLRAELRAFLELVEARSGQPVILYVGDEFERRYRVRESLGRPLWHRRILRRPNVQGWVVWQVHGYARVAGIAGDVDLDVMRADAR
jgi:lysozyme